IGWLEGSVSRSSLQFHFLQTLEHRTDVSVTSTSPWWEAPEEQGVPWGQLSRTLCLSKALLCLNILSVPCRKSSTPSTP
uniref:Uncharacterized protein n=1 Tax=Zonotrichia albicollis TaxID=44394 RepID=A0A8D2MUQ2_ZONAL